MHHKTFPSSGDMVDLLKRVQGTSKELKPGLFIDQIVALAREELVESNADGELRLSAKGRRLSERMAQQVSRHLS